MTLEEFWLILDSHTVQALILGACVLALYLIAQFVTERGRRQ